MRRLGIAAAALALAGCIPQVVQDMRAGRQDYTPPPPPPVERTPPSDEAPPADAPPPRLPAERLPVARQVWEARPVTPDARTVATATYDVRAGDTLARVAERTDAGAGAIARANDLHPPFALAPGQRLAIPGGRYHTVRAGQTGIAIARAYGVEWSRIVAANGLAEPFVLRAGERILIPGLHSRGDSTVHDCKLYSLNGSERLSLWCIRESAS